MSAHNIDLARMLWALSHQGAGDDVVEIAARTIGRQPPPIFIRQAMTLRTSTTARAALMVAIEKSKVEKAATV